MVGRADAQQNRERLVGAALAAFTADGPGASLEAIARAAGVGIGTLYRHFPTREALVEAVYRTELERLCAGAADRLTTLPPERALRAWFGDYADFVATKRGMAEALRAVIASGAITSGQTRASMAAAVGAVLAAGVEVGTVRPDVRAEDLVAALAAVVLTGTERDQVDRLLDLLVRGVLTSPPTAPRSRRTRPATAGTPSPTRSRTSARR